MAANNETDVISDLPGIAQALAQALAGSPALWLVDSVPALGKLRLDFAGMPIDCAPFSGHKLYAPKGIGLPHVRQGAPFTPLLCGGGQEAGEVFQPTAVLERWRCRLADALTQAFPGLVFNTPPTHSLPTTLNFSVPGVSAGSACSAARAEPSHVLLAMGLPEWRAASAVRLSFGPAMDPALIEVACERIAACGAALRAAQWAGDVPRSNEKTASAVAHTISGHVDAESTAACQISADALRHLLQAQPHTRVEDERDTAEQRLKPANGIPAPRAVARIAASGQPAGRAAKLADGLTRRPAGVPQSQRQAQRSSRPGAACPGPSPGLEPAGWVGVVG